MDAFLINFSPDSDNELVLNPKLAPAEKTVLNELKASFEKLYGSKNFFLVPSSGSSRQIFESVKLIALRKAQVLNSARRFNRFFDAGADDGWGMVLPSFHVAGIGILARAHLAGAKVHTAEWPVPHLTAWIERNHISFMSMVPAQIYDLVKNQEWAPKDFKKIFVGAGALNPLLRDQIHKLGWQVVETYGMTETASMVAIRKDNHFELMPEVEAKVENELLNIQCDSLLTASMQKIEDLIMLKSFEEQGWYETQDCAEMIDARHFRFLGRKTDYIKILGEGVSLSELRSVLEKAVLGSGQKPHSFEVVDLEDDRAGAKLYLAVEESVSAEIAETVLNQYNQACRPFEKIGEIIRLAQMPRTELGKLKRDELKTIIEESLKKGSYGES